MTLFKLRMWGHFPQNLVFDIPGDCNLNFLNILRVSLLNTIIYRYLSAKY